MQARMRKPQFEVQNLIAVDRLTAGMNVRSHGEHLILGRTESGPSGEPQRNDRVRLTRLTEGAWGLSVKRHSGRWERTPFAGTLPEMVAVMRTFMQHLVTP